MEQSKTSSHGGSGYHPLGWLGHLGWLRSEMRGSRRGNPRGSFGGEGCQVMDIDFSFKKKMWDMIFIWDYVWFQTAKLEFSAHNLGFKERKVAMPGKMGSWSWSIVLLIIMDLKQGTLNGVMINWHHIFTSSEHSDGSWRVSSPWPRRWNPFFVSYSHCDMPESGESVGRITLPPVDVIECYNYSPSIVTISIKHD